MKEMKIKNLEYTATFPEGIATGLSLALNINKQTKTQNNGKN